jgi:hypothetical protein
VRAAAVLTDSSLAPVPCRAAAEREWERERRKMLLFEHVYKRKHVFMYTIKLLDSNYKQPGRNPFQQGVDAAPLSNTSDITVCYITRY